MKLKLPKYQFGWREKLIALIGLTTIASGSMYAGLKATTSFFDAHTLQFNQILSVTIRKPLEIKKREVPTKEIVRVMEEIPEPQDLETDAEKYIYEVFGIEDYKLALAVAKSESGMREDAIGINTNGTVDIGIFQINSIHYKQEGCSLKEIVTVKGNVDCAYKIWQASGWQAWSAFKNGNFISKL